MADYKNNLSSAFADTKTRLIMVIFGIAVLIAIFYGVSLFFGGGGTEDADAALSQLPGDISTVPGSENPTAEYAKLQEKQNKEKAETALKTGGSAIPTIIRTEKIGEGSQPLVSSGEGGVGFSTLKRDLDDGSLAPPWRDPLRFSNCGSMELEAAIKAGAKAVELVDFCSCTKLSRGGVSLDQLKPLCECSELRSAGVNAIQMKTAGFSATELKICGFSACALKAAGYTASELRSAGFSDDELRGAGFTAEQIRAAGGYTDEVTPDDIRKVGCSVGALQRLRAQGVSAKAIRRISGCSAEALKAAGYTAAELKSAGFSAAELRAAGFSISDLKNAGFTAGELLDAGFTKEALLKAGFTEEAISRAIGLGVDPNMPENCGTDALSKARAKNVSVKSIRRKLGCSAAQFRAAGFTAQVLKDAGFRAAELKGAGFGARELKGAGFSARELKDAGFSALALKGAGFSAKDLKGAGFSAKDLKDAGFSAKALKDAGFSASELKNAGFTCGELKDAGFTLAELKVDVCSITELREAGYTAAELKAAGFTDEQIKNAGFSPEELEKAGIVAKEEEFGDPTIRETIARSRARLNAQASQNKILQLKSQMLTSADGLYANWTPALQSYVEGEQAEQDANEQIGQAMAAGGTGIAPAPLLKAGDILFAVLDTEVNSDEPSPVLAQVVQGEFKGAKLIGNLTKPANGERVVLNFTRMSLPNMSASIPLNAVAIDMSTARTAISSKTDNHYLLRYGSLFASSFLQGFGNAIQTNNTQVVSNGFSVSATQASRTLGENIITGLATVGQKWGQQVGQNFNLPPTVYVYAGTGVGILLTQDLILPQAGGEGQVANN